METRTNGSLACLLKSHLLSAIESHDGWIPAGTCSAHAIPIRRGHVAVSHLETQGWRDRAQAQARLRAGMGIVKLIQVVVGSLGLLTFGYH